MELTKITNKEEFNNYVSEVCGVYGFNIAYENIDQVSEKDYQQIRMDWFGASDSSRLLDVNPFAKGSSTELLHEKLTGEVDESIGKKASVRMGKDIEEVILRKLQEAFEHTEECWLDKPIHMYGNFNNHLGINFDAVLVNFIDNNHGVINKPIPVEIKSVTKYGRKYYNFDKSKAYQKDGEWNERDLKEPLMNVTTSIKDAADLYGIPVYYYTQLQQQMLALNSDIGLLAAMDVDNWDIHIFMIKKDDLVREQLLKFSERLWNQLKTTKELRKLKETKVNS